MIDIDESTLKDGIIRLPRSTGRLIAYAAVFHLTCSAQGTKALIPAPARPRQPFGHIRTDTRFVEAEAGGRPDAIRRGYGHRSRPQSSPDTGIRSRSPGPNLRSLESADRKRDQRAHGTTTRRYRARPLSAGSGVPARYSDGAPV